MTYQYKSPESQGYQCFHLSTSQHNQCFPKNPKKWQSSYEYYYTDHDIRVDVFVSPLAIALGILMSPLNLLWYGMGRFGEFTNDMYRAFHQKSTGLFHSYNISNAEECQRILRIAGVNNDIL